MEVPEAMLKKTVRIDGHAYRVLDYDGATKKLKLEVGTIIYVGPLAGKHDECVRTDCSLITTDCSLITTDCSLIHANCTVCALIAH